MTHIEPHHGRRLSQLGPDHEQYGTQAYALYGHSFGGLLAYECARQLMLFGYPAPHRLFVSACRPPQRKSRLCHIHTFPDQAFMGVLAVFGGFPSELLRDPDMVSFFADSTRNDYRLYEQYRHTDTGQPLSCPVTVITGDQDPTTSVSDLPDWHRLTSAPVTGIELAGAGHHFLEERAEELTEHITAALRENNQDLGKPITNEEFRNTMAHLPSAVTVVTTSTPEGPLAFTASSVCPLSADPPQLLVCVDRTNRGHDAFTAANKFMVNVLDESKSHQAQLFASTGMSPAGAELLQPCELGLPACRTRRHA
jgi:surfactin synthase thioesterase subunit